MPTTFDLRLATLRAAYREGRATPRQLIAELRDKAAALNPDYHLFIHLLTLEELEPYLAALDEKSPDSLPLYGIPFAIKDNIDLAGIPTTAACPAFAYTPETSATLVQQLIELGAIPLGKTNLDQFATGLNGTRPMANAATACCPSTRRAAPAPAPRWPWRWAWRASPWAPTPLAPAVCRQRSTACSG